ncbi:hypothetical protein POM88_031467 [Heracleum sosnowskyi]|uniref:F-box domain-containing protein n=1 Tax=Heracleum sosnowskyi TaxID=360622 RepID=A0AAD8MJT2_9APIA|nr:hypothetical protein POM88_031467 [Heracleum sosnowskyi]
MSWAGMPADILFIIFGLLRHLNNLNFLDLYQCVVVCRSWRFVAKQKWQTHILLTTPWLLQEEKNIENHNILFNTNPYSIQSFTRSSDRKSRSSANSTPVGPPPTITNARTVFLYSSVRLGRPALSEQSKTVL